MPPQLVDRPSTRIATAATGIESAARTWARMDEFEDDDFTSIRRPDTEAVRPDFQVEGDNRPVGRLYALGHVVFVQPKKTQVKGRGRAPATMAAKSRGATPGAPRSVPAAAKPSQAKQGGLSASNSEEGQEVLTLTLAPNPNPNRNRDRSPNRNPSHSPSPNPNPSPSPNPNPNPNPNSNPNQEESEDSEGSEEEEAASVLELGFGLGGGLTLSLTLTLTLALA